jgi:hypothetical protein
MIIDSIRIQSKMLPHKHAIIIQYMKVTLRGHEFFVGYRKKFKKFPLL